MGGEMNAPVDVGVWHNGIGAGKTADPHHIPPRLHVNQPDILRPRPDVVVSVAGEADVCQAGRQRVKNGRASIENTAAGKICPYASGQNRHCLYIT
jgi:hypothetical protein